MSKSSKKSSATVKKTATSVKTPKTYPPFEYGSTLSGNTFPMTKKNSAPALVVWLFLVTNADFQNDISAGNPPGGVSLKKIASATNLTEKCVQNILNKFAKAPLRLKKSFADVAEAFHSLDNVDYPEGNCPLAETVVQLAKKGAAVNPRAAMLKKMK